MKWAYWNVLESIKPLNSCNISVCRLSSALKAVLRSRNKLVILFLNNAICMKPNCSFPLSFFSKHQRWILAWRDFLLFMDHISWRLFEKWIRLISIGNELVEITDVDGGVFTLTFFFVCFLFFASHRHIIHIHQEHNNVGKTLKHNGKSCFY